MRKASYLRDLLTAANGHPTLRRMPTDVRKKGRSRSRRNLSNFQSDPHRCYANVGVLIFGSILESMVLRDPMVLRD